MSKRRVGIITTLTMLLSLVAMVGLAQAAPPENPKVDFYLTILHNNDGESQVIDAGSGLEDFGGAARFKAVADELKWEAIHGPWTQRGDERTLERSRC